MAVVSRDLVSGNCIVMLSILAAAGVGKYHWPDGFDWAVTIGYVMLILAIAAAGYACMVLDIRAYLRSLRQAIVLITNYRVELPDWVRRDTPRCIQAFGLKMPCTTDELL